MKELDRKGAKARSGKSSRDIASGGVLFVVAALYFVATWDLPAGRGEPGPAFFPILLSCALMVLALTILGQGLGVGSGSDSHGEESPAHGSAKPWLAVALTAVYISLFQVLGFTLSTLLYTFSLVMLFERRRLVIVLMVPVVSTGLIFLLFRVGLGLRLPEGILPLP